MKKITFLLFTTLFFTGLSAQCIRTDLYGDIVSNNSGNFQQVTDCAYSSAEFSRVSGLVVGGNYEFTAQTGYTVGEGSHIYLTVTNTSNVVIQHGPSPLTVNGITAATVRLHYSEDAACSGVADCRNAQVRYLTDCIVPSGLNTTNVTTTTAQLNWAAPTPAPSDGYDYYYSTANTAPTAGTTPSGSVAAGVTNVALIELSSGTQFYYWIRSKCGSSASLWSASGTFTTVCTAFTPTYIQDFTAFVPSCWSNIGLGTPATGPTGTDTGIWAQDGFLNSGTTGAIKANLYYQDRVGWMVSPVIDLSAGGYRVKFDVGATTWNETTPATMGSDDLVVFLISTDNGATWTQLQDFTAANTPSNALNVVTIPLTAYTSATTKFAFYATDGSVDDAPDYDFFIDNFIVETIPTCEAPFLTTSSITASSANFAWPAVAGAVGYEYVLDSSATDPAGAGTATTATSYDATMLASQTLYYFHVRTNCGSGFSNWTTVSFSTNPANDECVDAIALTAGGVYSDNVTNGTTSGASASSQADPTTCFGYAGGDVWYMVVIPASGNLTIETGDSTTGAAGLDTVITAYTGTCSNLTQVGCDDDGGEGSYSRVVLTGLTPGITLYLRVYEYSNDNTGGFGISAFDASLGTASFDAANFKAYPNPVKDILNLSYSQDMSNVAVFNLLGQQVLSKTVHATESQINMSSLSQGTYLVKVTVGEQVKTIKVIKQ